MRKGLVLLATAATLGAAALATPASAADQYGGYDQGYAYGGGSGWDRGYGDRGYGWDRERTSSPARPAGRRNGCAARCRTRSPPPPADRQAHAIPPSPAPRRNAAPARHARRPGSRPRRHPRAPRRDARRSGGRRDRNRSSVRCCGLRGSPTLRRRTSARRRDRGPGRRDGRGGRSSSPELAASPPPRKGRATKGRRRAKQTSLPPLQPRAL
jgi:hypothetical protein